MKYKRILAYLVDMILISIVILIISKILGNKNIDTLMVEMNSLNENLLSKKENIVTYLNHYSEILRDLDRQKILINFISVIIMFGYFVILPFKNNGQTLGKMLMKIKVTKEEEIKLFDYLVRSFIINGIFYMIVILLLVCILPSFSYFLTISILGFLQIILVITSAFMILYKKNEKGLEDILTKTEVVLIDEVEK
jgi:RDD family.